MSVTDKPNHGAWTVFDDCIAEGRRLTARVARLEAALKAAPETLCLAYGCIPYAFDGHEPECESYRRLRREALLEQET